MRSIEDINISNTCENIMLKSNKCLRGQSWETGTASQCTVTNDPVSRKERRTEASYCTIKEKWEVGGKEAERELYDQNM